MSASAKAAAAVAAAVVLAGERPGGNALARARGVTNSLTLDLFGRPVLDWSLAAVVASSVPRVVLVGPGADGLEHSAVQRWLDHSAVSRIAPAMGPAASALAGVEQAGDFPLLLTAADHALLTPAKIDQFCVQAARVAAEQRADVVVGLVDYAAVKKRFPNSRRTVLKFADRPGCGSNLFYLATPEAASVLQLWSTFESQRKRPWKIAFGIGIAVCLRYLMGRLSVDAAFAALSERAGAVVSWCGLDDPELAVDVDSVADLALAAEVLSDREVD